ncbi:MAG: sigma-54 dependent transcriptional regulator [Holosporales bacterium]|jgi:two-component system nitrogen regulation response regulator NtrX|nr:sigma-54 dependent transcriptional regulator [Holosporales bacterium]
MTPNILIVDDEPEVRRLIGELIEDEGYDALLASSSAEAWDLVAHHKPTMIFLDLWLDGDSSGGLALLEKLQKKFPDIPVVMISGHGTIEVALEAVRKGAYDFVEKPFVASRLLSVARRGCEVARLKEENSCLRQKKHRDTCLIGSSHAIGAIRRLLDKVAPTNSRVFLHSPIGGEGEDVAYLIHEKSHRKTAPFVGVNCSMKDAVQLEKDLFGEETATGVRKGLLEQAEGGTLFLEEVTDMPTDIQAKFLQMFQEGAFRRVGGTRFLQTDVRIMSSTSLSPEELQAGGSNLLQNLYYRLRIVPIEIPPIAERREDSAPLIKHFLDHSEEFFGMPPRAMNAELLTTLQSYHWPGNVRQVRNVVEWILIMASGSEEAEIGLDFLPPEISISAEQTLSSSQASRLIALPLKDARNLFERDYLTAQVQRFSGNISQTAEFVGMERSALHRKLKFLQIPISRCKEGKLSP